jgi:hypothetical protein
MKKHLKIIFVALAFIILIGLAIKLRFDIIGNEKAMPGLESARDQTLRNLELSKNEGIRLQRALGQSNELLKSLEEGLNKLDQGGNADDVNTEEEENALTVWFNNIEKMKDFVKNNPKYAIPEFKYLNNQQLFAATGWKMETEADYRIAAAKLRQYAIINAAGVFHQAFLDFSKAHNGNSPQNYADIQQYLPADFDYSRYAEIQPGEYPPGAAPSEGVSDPYIIKDIGPVDSIWDSGLWITAKGAMKLVTIDRKQETAVSDAIKKYKNENGGNAPTSSSQIGKYIKYNDNGKELSEANIDEIYKSMMTRVRDEGGSEE